jgi:hypothetical protein
MPGLLDPKPKQSPILGLLGTPPLTTMTPERFKAAGANLLNHQSVVGTAPNGQPITMSLGGLLNTGLEMAPGSGDYLAFQDFQKANQVGDRTGATLAAASLLPGIGDLAVGAKGLLAGKGALSMAGGLLGQTVFHGTPHNIPIEEGFRLDKIGTGEGAQAYGHGIYFAENPEVAGKYRESLADPVVLYDGVALDANDPRARVTLMTDNGGDPIKQFSALVQESERNARVKNPNWRQKMSAQMLDARKQLLDAAKSIDPSRVEVRQGGGLYTVDIPDDSIGKMLDWDKPLSEQPEEVRVSVQRALEKNDYGDKFDALLRKPGQATLQYLMPSGNQAEASQRLLAEGIPGIRYLDAGSRGAKEGTRNIVLFDPSLAKIVKKE